MTTHHVPGRPPARPAPAVGIAASQPTARSRARRDDTFAISGVVLALVVTLIALCVYIVYYRLTAIAPGSGLVSTLSPSRTVVTYVVIVFVCAAVAGGVGALAYLVSGRSVRAANGAMSCVLLLAIGSLGYSLYHNMQAISAAQQRVAGANTTSTGSPKSNASSSNLPPPPKVNFNNRVPLPPRPSVGERPRLPTTPTMPTTPATPRQTPAAPAPAGTPEAPVPAPAPAPTPTPAPEPPKADNPAIATTIASFESELDAQINALARDAETLLPTLNKRPSRDRVQIENRIRACDQVDADAKALSNRLTNPAGELTKRLTDAGVDATAARIAANTFSAENSRTRLISPLARIGFIVDAARDEAKLMLDNYNAWRITRNEVESKDLSLQTRLRGARSRTEMMARDAQSLIDELRGK